jgi:hypothetical protein
VVDHSLKSNVNEGSIEAPTQGFWRLHVMDPSKNKRWMVFKRHSGFILTSNQVEVVSTATHSRDEDAQFESLSIALLDNFGQTVIRSDSQEP